MRKFVTALALVSALTLMSACADDGYYARGGARFTYYDGYYDGFYGPLWSGYWGPDEYFYYSTARGRPFIRDGGRHFRRDQFAGYQHFHVADMHGRG